MIERPSESIKNNVTKKKGARTLYGDLVSQMKTTSCQPRIKYSVTAALKHNMGYAGNMNRSSLCAWEVNIPSQRYRGKSRSARSVNGEV
jgi:hypothetical protein